MDPVRAAEAAAVPLPATPRDVGTTIAATGGAAAAESGVQSLRKAVPSQPKVVPSKWKKGDQLATSSEVAEGGAATERAPVADGPARPAARKLASAGFRPALSPAERQLTVLLDDLGATWAPGRDLEQQVPRVEGMEAWLEAMGPVWEARHVERWEAAAAKAAAPLPAPQRVWRGAHQRAGHGGRRVAGRGPRYWWGGYCVGAEQMADHVACERRLRELQQRAQQRDADVASDERAEAGMESPVRRAPLGTDVPTVSPSPDTRSVDSPSPRVPQRGAATGAGGPAAGPGAAGFVRSRSAQIDADERRHSSLSGGGAPAPRRASARPARRGGGTAMQDDVDVPRVSTSSVSSMNTAYSDAARVSTSMSTACSASMADSATQRTDSPHTELHAETTPSFAPAGASPAKVEEEEPQHRDSTRVLALEARLETEQTRSKDLRRLVDAGRWRAQHLTAQLNVVAQYSRQCEVRALALLRNMYYWHWERVDVADVSAREYSIVDADGDTLRFLAADRAVKFVWAPRGAPELERGEATKILWRPEWAADGQAGWVDLPSLQRRFPISAAGAETLPRMLSGLRAVARSAGVWTNIGRVAFAAAARGALPRVPRPRAVHRPASGQHALWPFTRAAAAAVRRVAGAPAVVAVAAAAAAFAATEALGPDGNKMSAASVLAAVAPVNWCCGADAAEVPPPPSPSPRRPGPSETVDHLAPAMATAPPLRDGAGAHEMGVK